MSSNLEWQRQQVNERVGGALREGLAHRQVRGQRGAGARSTTVRVALILGAAWFFLAVISAGCTPVEPALAGQPGAAPAAYSMADRIAFQDQVWEASHPEPVDLTAYYESERTSSVSEVGVALYHASERGR